MTNWICPDLARLVFDCRPEIDHLDDPPTLHATVHPAQVEVDTGDPEQFDDEY